MTAKTKASTDTANRDDAKRFAELIGPTDPKLDREVREMLVTARVGMLLRASFFGNLATRLKLVNADEWCATAATDGRHFYYNTRFIKMLKPKEIEFLFGHEVLHCVYDHFGRRGDRDEAPGLAAKASSASPAVASAAATPATAVSASVSSGTAVSSAVRHARVLGARGAVGARRLVVPRGAVGPKRREERQRGERVMVGFW